MGTFAEIIDEAMKRKGWGYNRLSVEIGVLPSGGIFNPTQIRRLRLGERKHMSPELLERLIEVLDLPEDEAYHAAGLWPPGLDLEGYRRYRHLAASGRMTLSPGYVRDRRQRDRRRTPRHLKLVA
ncbi:MAG TPA: helix-turn-helix transcriptional regulator [Streptosporangiaceae bacterium]